MSGYAGLAFGAIGAAFFGPIGFAIGSMIGNLLFPASQPDGPRLQDLKLHTSTYGQMIPIVYGNMRVAGNVIWQTDLVEHEHGGGGKGGPPEQKTFSYSASFAIALCEGPIENVTRIWAAGELIYDITESGELGTMPCTLYLGTETQTADPTMEAELGVGNVPGYRGTAYVVFDDWDLSRYGNAIPILNFEVVSESPPPELRIVKENYATGYNLVGFFRSEVILNWDTTSIVVSSITSATGRILTTALQQSYDLDTFAALGTHVPPPTYTYPNYWSGPVPDAMGIGNYVFADGTVWPLWAIEYHSIHASAVDPPIITPSGVSTGGSTTDPAKFLHNAGVPDTGYCMGAVLSTDGTQLFVFTSPVSVGGTNKWYKIVDGLVVDNGTIAPAIAGQLSIWGSAATPTGSPLLNPAGSMENNGRWLWIFDPDPASSVELYYIDANGVLDDWGYGSLSITDNAFLTSGFAVGVKVIRDGYCGFATGTCLVEVSRFGADAAGIPLSTIVADLSFRAGLEPYGSPADVNVAALTDLVDGYIIQQQQAVRDSILPLQSNYFFDMVESSGVIKAVKRGGASLLTIPDSKLAARPDGAEAPAIVTVKRVQEVDLPRLLSVKYINAATDYQTGTQIAQRQVVESQLSKTIELNINMTDAKAMQTAKALLYSAWVERMQHTFSTGPEYDYLEPTDVVNVHSYVLRITGKRNVANDVIEFDGVDAITGIWTQGPTPVNGAGGFTPSTPPVRQPAGVVLLDTPLVRDTDEPNGIYVAMAGTVDATWRGAGLYKSSDGGTTYAQVTTNVTPATMGTASTALGDFPGGNVFDEANSVTVVIGVGGGTLASATELAVLNSTDCYLIGNEYVQAKNATLIAANTYTLTGLLRGRRGTEWAMPYHVAGERFVVMDAGVTRAPVLLSELGQSRLYKAVSFGMSLAGAAAFPFTSQGRALQPYSPAHPGGGCDASGNATINWQRRTRIGGAWADFNDVPLSEATESYVVQIYNSAYTQIARSILTTTPTCSYTAAQQTTDFGAVQQTVFFTVTQIGAFGLGVPAKGSAPSTGGSNTASPITPIPPYAAPPPQGGSTCPAPVTNDSIAWGSVGGEVLNPSFAPGETWLVSFITGASENAGNISLVEFGGPPCPRQGALSASPCGPPVAPFAAFSGENAPFIPFHVGPNNPHPGYIATLAFSTKYYFYVTTSQASASKVSLTH